MGFCIKSVWKMNKLECDFVVIMSSWSVQEINEKPEIQSF